MSSVPAAAFAGILFPWPPNYFSIDEPAIPSAGFSRSRESGSLVEPVAEAKVSSDQGRSLVGAGTQILLTRARTPMENLSKVSSASSGQAVLRLSGFHSLLDDTKASLRLKSSRPS